jgi:hypothetical protein
METQYIYLLQEREFIKTNENIFKIGKTKQNNNDRFKQYPKGSVLLFQIICCDCDNIERRLIKIFKEKYKQCKQIGNEYFDGDKQDMIKTIYDNITKKIVYINDTDECDEVEAFMRADEEIRYENIQDITPEIQAEIQLKIQRKTATTVEKLEKEKFLMTEEEAISNKYSKQKRYYDANKAKILVKLKTKRKEHSCRKGGNDK